MTYNNKYKLVTLGDLQEYYNPDNTNLLQPFFPDPILLSSRVKDSEWYNFLNNNISICQAITNVLLNKYSECIMYDIPRYYLNKNEYDTKDELSKRQFEFLYYKTIINNAIEVNSNKLDRIYKALVAEYNFLDNVDETRVEKTTRTPNLNSKDTLGTRSDSTTQHGFLDTIEDISNSPSDVVKVDTTVEDSSTYYPKDRTTTEMGQRINTQSIDSSDKVVDSTVGQQININELTGTDVTDYSVKRRGNIGVTSSQQLLTSEIEVADLDTFYKYYINIIIKELCSGLIREV